MKHDDETPRAGSSAGRLGAAVLAMALLAGPAVAAPQVFETAKLVVPRTVDDIVSFEILGFAVCATEDAAWVGEPVDKVVTSAEGSVFGFQRTPGGWELVHALAATKPFKSMGFGHRDRKSVV